MTRAMIMPLLFGLIGAAILISLGVWQVSRLGEKNGQLALIEGTVHGEPLSLMQATKIQVVKYTPVAVRGRTTLQEVHVLVSRKKFGAGYRIISAFEVADGPRVLLDRGFVRSDAKTDPRPETELDIIGNLHLPDDRNSSTPENDESGNIWFSRDIEDMSRALNTDPILIVARSNTGQGIDPMPLGVEGIPNDHLQYATTWFSLAVVWLGMTVFLLWRIKRQTDQGLGP